MRIDEVSRQTEEFEDAPGRRPPSDRDRSAAGAPITVVHVLPSLRSGGTENRVARVAQALDRSCFRVAVLSLSAGGELAEKLIDGGTPTVTVSRPAPRCWFPRHFRFLLFLWRFARTLGQLNPEVIHAHLPASNIYSAFARLTTCRHAKLVVSKASLGTYKKGRPLLRMAERWANRVADKVMVNSEAVGRAVIRLERAPAEKLLLVHNGVDVALFTPCPAVPAQTEPRSPRIGMIANLRPSKGHTTLLAAMVTVVEHHPKARLLCIGRNDGALAELQELACSLKLTRNVEFLGHRSDIPQLLQSLDVVVHTSEEEGFSNAILEGMAAGKPVVATAVGGTSEAVVDGVTGYLVPRGDSRSLAACIVNLLNAPALAASLGAAGRRRVEEEFSLEVAVAKTEDLYRALCGRCRPNGDSVARETDQECQTRKQA